jgi:ABC-type nitrate/sulfonate/bicarbonate transport system substrate-binding protein
MSTFDPLALRLDRRSLLAGAGAAGLAASLPWSAVGAADLRKAVLAYGSTGYTWALPFVAEAAGSWKEAGVALDTIEFESGRDSMQALLAGSADFSASTDTPLVFAALQGLRPLILVNYSRYSRDMKIVVRTDGAIDPSKPASLKGRKIATRVGTSGQYMLAKYLELGGLSPSDVEVVDLAPSNMTSALVRGDIDGFAWSSQSAAVASRQSGGKTTVMTQEGLEKYFQSHQLLLTSERVVKEKPELLAAAVKALQGAEHRIAADPGWADLISQRIRTPPKEILEATSEFTFKITFDDRFVEDLVAEAEWAIAAGLAKRPEGDLHALFRGLIVDAPVKVAAPDRVTLS